MMADFSTAVFLADDGPVSHHLVRQNGCLKVSSAFSFGDFPSALEMNQKRFSQVAGSTDRWTESSLTTCPPHHGQAAGRIPFTMDISSSGGLRCFAPQHSLIVALESSSISETPDSSGPFSMFSLISCGLGLF
jgi:hypothetical protein